MTCPTCGKPVPENLVSCPVCTAARNDAAVMAAQPEYFRRVRRGEWGFITNRATDGTRHIRMFGDRIDRAFCGAALTIDRRRTGSIAWGELEGICAGCRIEVKRVMESLDEVAA